MTKQHYSIYLPLTKWLILCVLHSENSDAFKLTKCHSLQRLLCTSMCPCNFIAKSKSSRITCLVVGRIELCTSIQIGLCHAFFFFFLCARFISHRIFWVTTRKLDIPRHNICSLFPPQSMLQLEPLVKYVWQCTVQLVVFCSVAFCILGIFFFFLHHYAIRCAIAAVHYWCMRV